MRDVSLALAYTLIGLALSNLGQIIMLKRIFWGGCLGMIWGTTLMVVEVPSSAAMAFPSSQILVQAAVSSEDLQKFAKAIAQFQTIDIDTQEKLSQAVQKNGLSPDRFLEIGESRREGASKPSNPVTSEEEAKFKQAIGDIQPILEQDQSQKERAIVTAGLTIERFQAIGESVESDSKLQDQLRKILGDNP
jgi:hypothetical protein